jgi:peptide/nickel transport system substrate-binding protein
MGKARINRREGLKLLAAAGLGGMAASMGAIRFAYAADGNVLVIGLDISDTNSFDPGRQFVYSAPITMHAAYDCLVTMKPGDYETVLPSLATSWEFEDDGAALLFHLREGVKFSSGNPLTAEDVKFSFDRLINLKDNPAELASNIDGVDVVDPLTVRIRTKDKTQPLLTILVGPTFSVSDSKVVIEHDGTSAEDADTTDKATSWLDNNSAGSGPYVLTRWEPNAQVVLEENANYWGEASKYSRIVLQHIPESATQLITLQRGDIQAALNLTAQQLDGLKDDPNINMVEGTSLDYVYLTLTSGADLNPSLGIKEARQAIAYAINYDEIIKGLVGGYATRPPSFVPNGLGGMTEELTNEIGYRYDPDKAKDLLKQAGLESGFSFDLSYGDASVAGTTYSLLAQTIQSQLAAVGITANLQPLDQSTARDKYRAGELASCLTFWNPDGPEAWTWASASVQRVADRVRWKVPAELTDLVARAGGASNPEESHKLYREYAEALIDNTNYIILFQPIYRVAVRKSVAGWEMTATGWQVDLGALSPA